METVIEIKHLEKDFNNIPILTDINLELKRGENIAILGKSGTGKSVLTKCIVRLVEADDGEVLVLGNDVLRMDDEQLNEIRKKLGTCFRVVLCMIQ